MGWWDYSDPSLTDAPHAVPPQPSSVKKMKLFGFKEDPFVFIPEDDPLFSAYPVRVHSACHSSSFVLTTGVKCTRGHMEP